MSLITPEANNYFKSASFIFSKVKGFLSSYDAAGMIDDGEFPTYVKEVLRLIGISVYEEKDAVMAVKNHKAKLPANFSMLYCAYKCSPFVQADDIIHLQGKPMSVYNDVTWELLEAGSNCDIQTLQLSNADSRIIEKITVRQLIKETPVIVNFKNPVLLRLSPNVKHEFRDDNCPNILASCIEEITISNNIIYTNFTNDSIYMKYYAFPVDESGVPKILDNEKLEKAVEWHIICEILKGWWFNGSVPDIENKWKAAEAEAAKWIEEAKRERKMPYFEQMINNIRRNRSINKIAVFAR